MLTDLASAGAGGETTVSVCRPVTSKLVVRAVPNWTEVTTGPWIPHSKAVPVSVTVEPPALGPDVGLIETIRGGSRVTAPDGLTATTARPAVVIRAAHPSLTNVVQRRARGRRTSIGHKPPVTHCPH